MDELRKQNIAACKKRLAEIDKLSAGSKERAAAVDDYCKMFGLEKDMRKIDLDWTKSLNQNDIDEVKNEINKEKNEIELEKIKMEKEDRAAKQQIEEEKNSIAREKNSIDQDRNNIDREKNETQARDSRKDKIIGYVFEGTLYIIGIVATNKFCNEWRVFEQTGSIVSKADRAVSGAMRMFIRKKR